MRWCLILFLILSGCSTMRESLVLGASSGAVVGAVSGASLSYYNKGAGAIEGALVGAAFGGILSFFIHKGLEDRDRRVKKETLFELEKFELTKFQTLEVEP